MSYLKKLQEEAREKIGWLPSYFTVTELQDEQVSGWIRSDIEWEFLRHVHEKETGVHFMMRHDDRARKAKQQQRFYIKHEPIPINKHPFSLYRLITYACEHKDLGPSRRRIPDHMRKKKSRMNTVEKVDCPAKITLRKVTIYDGFFLPPKASTKKKMKVVKDLRIQLEINPDLVPKTNWIFVTLPLQNAHRNHAIVKYETTPEDVGTKEKKQNISNMEEYSDFQICQNTNMNDLNDSFQKMDEQHTSDTYKIITSGHLEHSTLDGNTTSTYIMNDQPDKQNTVLVHEQDIRNRQNGGYTWINYPNEVDQAVASVTHNNNSENICTINPYEPNKQQIHHSTQITNISINHRDQNHSLEEKVFSITRESPPRSISNAPEYKIELEVENSSPGISRNTTITPNMKNNLRQRNIAAHEKHVHTNLALMNITTTIDLLKKLKEIVPSCADENIVESVANIRKKLNELYDRCKYQKINDSLPLKPNKLTSPKKRTSLICKTKPVKKRKSEDLESDVHTMMPAIIHSTSPLNLVEHEATLIGHHHQNDRCQMNKDHNNLISGTLVSTVDSNTISHTVPSSTGAHHSYPIHDEYESSVMSVWIQQ